MSQIAEFLRPRLQARGAQAEFARKLGVSSSLVSLWLNGTIPEPPQCRKIADALGVPRDLILSLAGHSSEEDEPVDAEKQAMLSELAEVFESFDRSRWRDLLTTVKGVVALATAGKSANSGAPVGADNPGDLAVIRTDGANDDDDPENNCRVIATSVPLPARPLRTPRRELSAPSEPALAVAARGMG